MKIEDISHEIENESPSKIVSHHCVHPPTMVIDVEVSVSGSSNLVTDSTCTLIHETLTNITYMRTVLRGKKIKFILAYE